MTTSSQTRTSETQEPKKEKDWIAESNRLNGLATIYPDEEDADLFAQDLMENNDGSNEILNDAIYRRAQEEGMGLPEDELDQNMVDYYRQEVAKKADAQRLQQRKSLQTENPEQPIRIATNNENPMQQNVGEDVKPTTERTQEPDISNEVSNEQINQTQKTNRADETTRGQRLGSLAKSKVKPKLKNAPTRAANTVANVSGKVVGAAALGTVGLAAGMVSGDMSKGLQYAATGAAVGGTFGNNITKKKISDVDTIKRQVSAGTEDWRRAYMGEEEYQKSQATKNVKRMAKNDKNVKKVQAKIKNDNGSDMTYEQAQNWIKDRANFYYVEQGITTNVEDMIKMDKYAKHRQTKDSKLSYEQASKEAAAAYILKDTVAGKKKNEEINTLMEQRGLSKSDATKLYGLSIDYRQFENSV